MGSILKFVAALFLIAFLLVFTIPLIWLVINLFGWMFGGFFEGGGSDILWIAIIVISVIGIIIMAAS